MGDILSSSALTYSLLSFESAGFHMQQVPRMGILHYIVLVAMIQSLLSLPSAGFISPW